MKKIFIVDDDQATRMQYQAEFTSGGYEVIASSDCKGFIKTIVRHQPDLIILHIKTGRVHELKTLEELRNNGYEMPVILSTEYLSLEMVKNLLQQIKKSHEIRLG